MIGFVSGQYSGNRRRLPAMLASLVCSVLGRQFLVLEISVIPSKRPMSNCMLSYFLSISEAIICSVCLCWLTVEEAKAVLARVGMLLCGVMFCNLVLTSPSEYELGGGKCPSLVNEKPEFIGLLAIKFRTSSDNRSKSACGSS